MVKESLILICASVIFTQLVVVSAADLVRVEDIDWATVHDELRKLGASVRKKCMAETSVPLEVLDGAEIGKFPEEGQLACYFKCVMIKGGVMKKDGKINYKMLAKMLPQAYKHIGMEMLDQCRNTDGNDNCEKAMNFNKCMYSANPVAYFVI